MATFDNDTIFGGVGDDSLNGLAGDDTIYGFTGNDTLSGDTGNDMIVSHAGDDVIYGRAGDDHLINDDGADTLYGGLDNDQINMGTSVFEVFGESYGGRGDDLIMIARTKTASAYGGEDNDTLSIMWFQGSDGTVHADFSAATPFATSSGGNLLSFGGFENYSVLAGTGNDTIRGAAGNDTVHAQGGEDLVEGMDGDDHISFTNRGAHTLYGGLGEDTLTISSESSALYFLIDGPTGVVNEGNLSVITGFEHYQAYGGALDDIVRLGRKSDRFFGSAGDDTAIGGGGWDILYGQGDDDVLFGNFGNDLLHGGIGNDVLSGGKDQDTIIGGKGNDTLTGGHGADDFEFEWPETTVDLITDFTSGQDRLLLSALFVGSVLYVGPAALTPGAIAPDQLAFDDPIGTQEQFVLRYDSISNESILSYDGNGDLAGGDDVLIRLSGLVNLVASDIVII